VPVLLWMLPDESPATITAISLAVVFFNAYSGTIAYMRTGRIDYRAGTLFSVAGAPGAVLGALLVRQVSRGLFEPLFGVLLISIGGFLVYNPLGAQQNGDVKDQEPAPDRMRIGAIGSAYIAIVSSLLGIGGGVIHVPFLIRVLQMPPHVATATSHFVLTFMALTATVTHVALGEFQSGIDRTMYLAVGVMMGAPLGAALSARVRGSMIVRMLAGALCLVGARLLLRLL